MDDVFVDRNPSERIMIGKLASNRTEKSFDDGYKENKQNQFTSIPSINVSFKVKKNDIVQAGTILGTTGATGFATGVHLHYAVKENGKWVDPLDYLTGNKQLPSLKNSTPIVDTGSKDIISYKVQKGDTLTKIAKMYKTTISELVNLNNIQNPNLIITGTILKVPNNNVENISNNYYIVKKGDTLSGIAKKYNTTWKKILSCSNILYSKYVNLSNN